MSINRASLVDAITSPAPRQVTVNGYGEAFLRSPTFGEWYPIIVEQRRYEGQLLPLDVVAKTIAVVLSDSEGNRLIKPGEEQAVLRHPPLFVMALFNACMEQMGLTDKEVQDTKGK